MKLSSLIAARPVIVFMLLTFLVLLVPCLLTPWWYNTAKRLEQKVDMSSHNLRSVMLSKIETSAKLLHSLNSSAIKLGRVMNSSIGSNELSFVDIQTRVAPSLFLAFSTIPHLSQISYIGLDGLLFSYYMDHGQTLAVYCNSSSDPDSSAGGNRKKQTWYTQPVDPETGKLNGEATVSRSFNINSTRLQEILNRKNGFASKGCGWNEVCVPLFTNTANINGRAAVSLGFSVEAIINFFTGMDLYGASLSMATNDGQVLVEGLPDAHMNVANNSISFQSKTIVDGNVQTIDTPYITCLPPGAHLYHILNIRGTEYNVYCSHMELAGLKSVYALVVPHKGVASFVYRTSKLALMLLILMIVSVLIFVFSFVFLMVRSAKREMHLCAALIKQMESTQQAERKSMNKSCVYANASHDIRAYLAGIIGLIEICYPEVTHGSELETNLRQMEDVVKKLIALLNSVLDKSKIDAGKMQLNEEEFDVGQLLEIVVDLFHSVGIQKGVDVVLDSFDSSINKFSHVKGDREKLDKVLCNLLHNALKFTSEGHITVRAWVQKPSLENSIISSNRNGFLKHLILCLFSKNKTAQNNVNAVNSVINNPNCMEFVFEVDDTGKGIPKEKQQSVFENYVQVKEGQGGTGLGLGIVQSLVRLMGGEITITDKPIGEKGTCFRFNVFLTVDEAQSDDNTRSDVDMGVDSTSGGTLQQRGLTVLAPNLGLTIRTPSPRLTNLVIPKLLSSQVVLLIACEERRRMARRYLEHLGINVSIIERWQTLQTILKKIKNKLGGHSPHNSLGKLDMSFMGENSNASLKDVPLSALEGTDQRVQSYRLRGGGGGPSFVLLVIDATAGPFSELLRVVTEFREDLQCRCKVVWLDKPISRSINFNDPEAENMMDPSDDIITKPLHGSRLIQVTQYLPEFGGTYSPSVSARPSREKGSSSFRAMHSCRRTNQGIHCHLIQQSETQEEDSSGSGRNSTAPVQTHSRLPSGGYKSTQTEIEEIYDAVVDKKPLSGKRFLVAEDNTVLRKLARIHLTRLGATVQVCENGEEAVDLVRNGLNEQIKHGGPPIMSYDYILMDCEMPIMNGFEATKQIRKEERYYGVHIPIIALTAHVSGEQVNNTILAGMDVHLGKPLKKENLLDAIRYIDNKYKTV